MSPNITAQINYLLKITDNVGLIEHCRLDEPNYTEGYCVDDNARALQVCLRLKSQFSVLESVFPIYFNFLKSAIKKDGLYNDLNHDKSWQKTFEKNGEHLGRALAALGEANSSHLFDQIYLSVNTKTSHHLRTFAQIILGLQYYRSQDIKLFADLLVSAYLKEKTLSWNWFESEFSHDNARLPLALLIAFQVTPNPQYLKIALKSLDFLTQKTFDNLLHCFVFPIDKNFFGQQPIEAGSLVEVYVKAFQITQNSKYKSLALTAFDWYHGQNILKVSLINPKTGGIYDGLEKNGVNLNQGAESVLSYLLAYHALQQLG